MLRKFFIILFLLHHAVVVKSQINYNRPGFKPYSLPKFADYTIRNSMRLTKLDGLFSSEENNSAIFADNILIDHLQIFSSKNVIVFANSVTVGSDNTIVVHSDNRTGGSFDGGSLIIICRKLKIAENASFFINGTALNFQAYQVGTQPADYTGSYGFQFLLAAEELAVPPSLNEYCVKEHLRAYDQYVQDIIADDSRELKLREILSTYLSQYDEKSNFYKYRAGEMSKEKYQLYKSFLESKIVNKEKTAKLAHELRSLYYSFNININTLTQFTNQRSYRGVTSFPELPYYPFLPFIDPLYLRKSEYYATSKFPFVVSTDYHDQYIYDGDMPIAANNMFSTYPASAEVFGGLIGSETLSKLPKEHQKLFSSWALEWIKFKRTEALQAKQLDNTKKYFNILREISEMPRYELNEPYEGQYNSINTEMLLHLKDAKNLVSSKAIILDAPLAGRVVNTFVQGIPPTFNLPPTDIILSSLFNNGNWHYGIVEEKNYPERFKRLSFQGVLKIDPLIQELVGEKIERLSNSSINKIPILGLKYEVEGVKMEGIKKFSANVEGDIVNITIDVYPEQLAKVMLRLATTGLPYYLKWKIDGTPLQSGQLDQPMYLNLRQRTGGRIIVENDMIVNGENNGNAIIKYFQTSLGRILPVDDLKVEAGNSIPIPDLELKENEKIIAVPDLGIQYGLDNFDNILDRFLVLPDGLIIDKIITSNVIPAIITIEGENYQIRNLEVDISLIDEDNLSSTIITHEFLSPAGSIGSSITTQIPKLITSNYRYKVTGRIHLSQGSVVNLKPSEYNSPIIDITEDLIDRK